MIDRPMFSNKVNFFFSRKENVINKTLRGCHLNTKIFTGEPTKTSTNSPMSSMLFPLDSLFVYF